MTFMYCMSHVKAFITIIIKKGLQCKAGRERLTPYQSETPAPQYQPIEWKKSEGKQ